MIDPIPFMWTWAEWRRNGCRRTRIDPELGASIPAMTGKIMAGMGAGTCPSCHGEGRMPGWKVKSDLAWIDPCPQCNGWGKAVTGELSAESGSRTLPCEPCGGYLDKKTRKLVRGKGEINGATCLKCRGAGIRHEVILQVNPAGIPATRHVGANEDDDPVSMMIDRTVAEWVQTNFFFWYHKIIVIEYASAGTQEMKALSVGCSTAFYSRTKKLAHAVIAEKLDVMFREHSI